MMETKEIIEKVIKKEKELGQYARHEIDISEFLEESIKEKSSQFLKIINEAENKIVDFIEENQVTYNMGEDWVVFLNKNSKEYEYLNNIIKQVFAEMRGKIGDVK